MADIKKIKVNGTELAYQEFGQGDKYLLSMQNFFFTDCHASLLGQEPYDYHVFLIYMRGYGQSEHIFDSTPRDYVSIWGEDLIAFAEAMGIKKFYYTGISHGNWAGWYTAFHRPELIRAFVCCDGIVQFRNRKEGVIPTPKKPDWDNIVGKEEELKAIAWKEPWNTENPKRLAKRAENEKEHLQILLNRKKEEFELQNTSMTCCDAETEEELYQKLSEIKFPVMIWNGELDPAAKAIDCLKVSQVIPGAVLLMYQSLGHGGADECPELTARDCARFFHDCQEWPL